ncbi:MAG: MBL fold metallo-hydrolase [Pseudomonadota bacterium]
MHLTFLGATGTVTGSKYLITVGPKRILVDCGLFQGLKQLRLRNWEPLPIDPKKIDAVILTHAHIDHSGYLPLLSKKGFSGTVYCSRATRDLCEILLPDSGHLQEEEAEYANRKGFSKHSPALPLYTQEDAERCLTLLVPFDLDRDIDLGDGISLRFSHSGHILGSCFVRLTHEGRTIVFTGDLGRPNDIVMKPPVRVAKADYLVLESTYGDRLHGAANPEAQLTDIINRTVQRGGVVVVPTFAVGRAQELLYYVHLLKASRAIPDIPIYLNSPMAVDATRIFHEHPGEHRLTHQQCEDMCHAAKIVNSVEESKQLNTRSGPMVILAASGMATGGRVVHHLKAFAPDARNTILFGGFQAAGTRGAAMLAGTESIKIHGEYVPVRAEVAALSNLSAHADYAEIMGWLGGFDSPPQQTFITHGEPVAADALRHRIEEQKGWRCRIPDYLETVDLG